MPYNKRVEGKPKMIESTTGMVKISATWGTILTGSLVDGQRVTKVQDDTKGNTRFWMKGSGWTTWRPSETPISYHI